MEPPTLDLSFFTTGDNPVREEFASDLLFSLTQHGFVKLKNHGVPEEEVCKLWDVVKESLKDAREHFDMGSKYDREYSNRWPQDAILPRFCLELELAFERMQGISAALLEALEVAFKLPSGTFLNKITHEKNASEFRLNHYPQIQARELKGGTVNRIWPHFDLRVITLLFQDNVGGLEFENRESPGTFTPVRCISTSDLIVNVSETLQRWTNNCLRAGLHRVDLPQNEKDSQGCFIPEKYSIAYFCKADREASVGLLKQFVNGTSKPLYREISALEYQKERLLSAY